MVRVSQALLLLFSAASASCTGWIFSSGNKEPDRSRPVARIDLRGQPSQLGATTEEGIVFLNADKASGACRVHYFLGPDLIVEDGTVSRLGGGYALAKIDLKHQAVPVLNRDPTPADDLVAIVLAGGSARRYSVELARDGIASGYALEWPGVALPYGTGIFRVRTGRNSGELQFVGLCNGVATVQGGGGDARYVTFTGPARMREALATPKPLFKPHRVEHRADGISVRKK